MGLVQSLCSCGRAHSFSTTSPVTCSAVAPQDLRDDLMLNVPSTSNSLTAKPAIGRSEYGRIKVALPRGKGLMDWVVLTKNKVLASKRIKYVDHEELSKHDKVEDCWVAIHGQVYDVSSYLEFHPGGVDELMRAAGRDGTDLFNQYHAWVNYQNMLQSCHVGQFKGDLSKLKPCGRLTALNSDSLAGGDKDLRKNTLIITSLDRLIVSNEEWSGIPVDCVTMATTRNTLRLLVRPFGKDPVQIEWIGVPTPIGTAPFSLSTSGDEIVVAFATSISLKVLESPSLYTIEKKPMPRYHECNVVSIDELNRDTKLYKLSLPKDVSLRIPVGHHISVAVRKRAATLYRDYTPVMNDPNFLQLMIKIYPDGLCTPTISKWKEGDTVSISDPIGDWDLSEWTRAAFNLLVIAAGTGWTPMVELVKRRIAAHSHADTPCVDVLYFNKTEYDIIDDSWMPFKWSDRRIRVTHILSRPSEQYTGRCGRISAELLQEIVTYNATQRVAVCGPDGFIQGAVSALTELGYTTDQVHVFQG